MRVFFSNKPMSSLLQNRCHYFCSQSSNLVLFFCPVDIGIKSISKGDSSRKEKLDVHLHVISVVGVVHPEDPPGILGGVGDARPQVEEGGSCGVVRALLVPSGLVKLHILHHPLHSLLELLLVHDLACCYDQFLLLNCCCQLSYYSLDHPATETKMNVDKNSFWD